MPANAPAWKNAFLDKHRLSPAYLDYAQSWFEPLARALTDHQNGAHSGRPPATRLIAVNGSQGSGKSTVCAYLSAYLQAEHDIRALVLSLDDFYLTRAQRRELSASVHPLLATRGVPGTHDMPLLTQTLDALTADSKMTEVAVPRFDKARDDRRRPTHWDRVEGRIDIVLLEGWCLGARPQSPEQLLQPVNELEREEDPDGLWRSYANDALRQYFLPLYQRVDQWVMLAAPSFGSVYRWRLEQEEKLAAASGDSANSVMNEPALKRFIQYFQRLTEHCLATVPDTVDYLYSLDERRDIVSARVPWSAGL